MTPMTDLDPNGREALTLEAARFSGHRFTVRQIGRCFTKGCKAVAAADVEFETRCAVRNTLGMAGLRLEHSTVRVSEYPALSCGHGSARWQRVDGRKSDTKCGPRCWNARRHDCECECEGKNHGQGHLATA